MFFTYPYVSSNPGNKRHRTRFSFEKAFSTRKLILKTEICGTNIKCSKNERTYEIYFLRMRCNAAKIIIKTCKCLFAKRSVDKLLFIT